MPSIIMHPLQEAFKITIHSASARILGYFRTEIVMYTYAPGLDSLWTVCLISWTSLCVWPMLVLGRNVQAGSLWSWERLFQCSSQYMLCGVKYRLLSSGLHEISCVLRGLPFSGSTDLLLVPRWMLSLQFEACRHRDGQREIPYSASNKLR